MDSPCSPDEANAMATHAVAQGAARERGAAARPQPALSVALGQLPMVDLDAEATLDMLLANRRPSAPHARKTIRVVKR